jgi:hypothetical protein
MMSRWGSAAGSTVAVSGSARTFARWVSQSCHPIFGSFFLQIVRSIRVLGSSQSHHLSDVSYRAFDVLAQPIRPGHVAGLAALDPFASFNQQLAGGNPVIVSLSGLLQLDVDLGGDFVERR